MYTAPNAEALRDRHEFQALVDRAEISPEDETRYGIESWLPRVTADDVLDEMAEATEVVEMANGDALTIGRIWNNVKKAYAARLYFGEVHGHENARAVAMRANVIVDAKMAAIKATVGVTL